KLQPVSFVYPVVLVEDRSGNRIRYKYEIGADSTVQGEFSYRLSAIEYSYGAGSNPPRRQLRFMYESRPDPITASTVGVRSVTRSRLVTIEAWAPSPTNTDVVWRYRFEYGTSADSGRSLLRRVRLCDRTDVCSWGKTFEWTTSGGYHEHTVSDEVEI